MISPTASAISRLERWKEIPNSGGRYAISSMGRVRGARGQIINPYPKGKYVAVTICVAGGQIRKRVHRLVAEAFIPNPGNKPFVNHKNFDTSDNRLENLEWCTHQENMRHYFREFPQARFHLQKYPNGYNRKLSDEQVRRIKSHLRSGATNKATAERFAISRSVIARIRTGKAYAHVC